LNTQYPADDIIEGDFPAGAAGIAALEEADFTVRAYSADNAVHYDILTVAVRQDIADTDLVCLNPADSDRVVYLDKGAHTAGNDFETYCSPFPARFLPHFDDGFLGIFITIISIQMCTCIADSRAAMIAFLVMSVRVKR
jgi:hypothetical protein